MTQYNKFPPFAPLAPTPDHETSFLVQLLKGTSVSNAVGTSDDVPAYGTTWLGFYRFESRNETDRCSMVGCRGSAEVGAHVRREYVADNQLYIVPACKGCNGATSVLTVRHEVSLVPAKRRYY
jgi:hypothetical protein